MITIITIMIIRIQFYLYRSSNSYKTLIITKYYYYYYCGSRSGLMVSAVRVRALAGVIVLCSWARHFTLTVRLSTQGYKWVSARPPPPPPPPPPPLLLLLLVLLLLLLLLLPRLGRRQRG